MRGVLWSIMRGTVVLEMEADNKEILITECHISENFIKVYH
jgi:hypothetical protein